MSNSPEWEIEKSEFLRRLEMNGKLFKQNMCLPDFGKIERIVPLRYLQNITAAPIPMNKEVLYSLVSKIRTLGNQKPFASATLEMQKVDPSSLKVGQKFVYRENYQSLLENLTGLFGRFAIPSGISDLGAYFVFGEDLDGRSALACYTPPFIEDHDGQLVIMDGIHRDYIVKQLGTTINAIVVRNVSLPFPCGLHPWKDVEVISLNAKPGDINERYFELKKDLFRDLKYLGIDG